MKKLKMSETDVNQEINIRPMICRTCLEIRKNLINMFEHIRNNKLISEILMECIRIHVQKDDGLPKNICNICLDKLNIVSDFRAMVFASEVRLHNFYSNSFKEELQGSIIEQASDKTTEKIGKNFIESSNGINVKEEDTAKCIFDSSKSNSECTSFKSILKTDKSVIFEESNTCGNALDLEMIQNNAPVIKDGENIQTELNTDFKDVFEDTNSLDLCANYSSDSSRGGSAKNNNDKDRIGRKGKAGASHINKKTCSKLRNTKKKESKNSVVKIDDILRHDEVRASLNYKEKRNATLVCQVCKKTFSYHYYFSIHLPQHLGQLPFKCEICNKSFPKKSLLNTHKKSHSEDKPFACEICGKTFKYMGALRTHGILHVDVYPYKCELCTRMFKHVYSLQVHLLRHSGEKPVICDICGKSFINQADMNKHAIVHGNDRSFPCEICGKFYKSKRSLGYHRKKHLDLKPYECNYCNKRFHTKTILQHHISIHTGAKPYACTVCGKTFRQKNCIGRHMRLHTGETPYACEKCPSKFKYSHLLINHMKIHK